MSRFTPETIERVRDAADIVEIVSAYTDLRRSGENYSGLCPFHDERSPSFSVKPALGLYYCFGCQAGGDAIRFVQEKEGLGFADAIESLADRFGVEVERVEEDPRAEERRRRRGRLGEALERAAAYYVATLWDSDKARGARRYLLEERGLEESVLKDFGVGFAPSRWDSILTRGQQAGFDVEELREAGLVQRSSSRPGSHYDRFRGRITFPVRDQRGRVVGFGARAMGPDDKPKYLNSAEGELYRKSSTLYGIDRAKAPIARGGRAVVVEGYTDVLALHAAGIEEAVAVMGTAITPDQLKILAGYAEEVVLALDADRAGREAMLRAQRVAGSGKLRLLVAAMPEGEDPADMMVSEGGSERLRGLIADAVELPAFHVRAILTDADLSTPGGRDRALDEVAPVLAGMEGTIVGQEMVREVADRIDAAPELIAKRMKDGPRKPPPAQPTAAGEGSAAPAAGVARAPRRAATPQERREASMLAMCLSDPEHGIDYVERLTPEHFTSPILREVHARLKDHLEAPLEGLGDDDARLINAISRLQALEANPPAQADFGFRFVQLEHDRIDRELRSLAPGDERAVELAQRKGKLSDRIAKSPGMVG